MEMTRLAFMDRTRMVARPMPVIPTRVGPFQEK